jgi:radical SAM family uncharacterized protein
MTNNCIELLADRVDREFLEHVRKPGRYIGGEVNQIRKDLSACELRVALCFPDVYEVAMSHTGLAVIYACLNAMERVAAERVFSPWTDAEAVLRDKQIPLFSLESKASLKSFDLIGFNLSSELCYTNVLNMLDLGGLALRSVERRETDPLVIAGGGMAHCCEPIAPFIDAFVLGDGEETAPLLVEHVRKGKLSGDSKEQILHAAARQFEWIYVPALYEFEYDQNRIKSVQSRVDGLAVRRENAVVEDFENAPVPTKPIVPLVEAVHERVCIEIMRGCPGRCRFCQVSFCKRPIRHRSVQRIVELARACYEATGFDTVSLLSLSSAEYPHLEPLIGALQEVFQGKHVGLSVPSLRVDRQLRLLPKLLTGVRKSGLTIAVEAASERLRTIVNKPLTDEDLFAAVEAAYQAGWQRVKLYFMVGLPSETEQDIKKIVELSNELSKIRGRYAGGAAQVNAAISWLVPKAHTPLAWLPQASREYFDWAKDTILETKRRMRVRSVKFKFHDTGGSVLESALGRGNRHMAEVIERAWQLGARFDLWDECFDLGVWQQAFTEAGLDLDTVAARAFAPEEILPWEHLGGPDKATLLRHYHEVESLMGTPSENDV